MSDQAGEGFEHTELERALVNWMDHGGFGRSDVESGRPVRSLFLMEDIQPLERPGVEGSRPARPLL